MKGKILSSGLALVFALLIAPAAAVAGWNVSIGINLPGFFYYEPAPGPPPAAMYGPAAPAMGPAYFYGGLWYRPAAGRWFVAVELAGPWSFVATESVPSAVTGVPVYQGPGQDADGRYIAPRLYYGGDDE